MNELTPNFEAREGAAPADDDLRALAREVPLEVLIERADALRAAGHGPAQSYSRNVLRSNTWPKRVCDSCMVKQKR